MNREIKFRAYDKEDEEMRYFDDENYLYHYPFILRLEQVFKKDSNYDDYEDFEYKDVTDKIELMQYTGLHDKNGKEIYEGDIVLITRPCILEKGEVKFMNGCFTIKSKDTLLMLYQCEINNFKLVVIGNIYDNPELLGGENE